MRLRYTLFIKKNWKLKKVSKLQKTNIMAKSDKLILQSLASKGGPLANTTVNITNIKKFKYQTINLKNCQILFIISPCIHIMERFLCPLEKIKYELFEIIWQVLDVPFTMPNPIKV
jgi:hypothetical protein